MFSCIAEPLGLVSMSEVWLFGCNSSMKMGVSGPHWFLPSSEPTALLNSF